MGIEVQALRLLLFARDSGVRFDRSLMIGRQDILLTPECLADNLAQFGTPLPIAEASRAITSRDRFAEPIFELLGADVVDSMDGSGYEGATIVHDLNQPLDPALAGRKYSLVFDGGTLEHIFHVPNAIQTFMSLVEEGGHLVMVTPANNDMGHGFYQFSPEFFYRVLSPENGFEVKAMFLAKPYEASDWWEIRDPAEVRSRVGFNSWLSQSYILLIARRVATIPLFRAPPTQSDYAAEWQSRDDAERPHRLAFFDHHVAYARPPSAVARLAKRILPPAMIRPLQWLRDGRRASALPDPRHFSRFPLKSKPVVARADQE